MAAPQSALVVDESERVQLLKSLPFLGFHVVAVVAAILVPPTAWDLVLCAAMYYLRMFGIAGGFHRYFAHRSYKTSLVGQFLLAFLGGTAMQKGGLWWAANHRHHHRFSDQPEDVHSPVQRGFWYSHVGWILTAKWERTDLDAIPDFAKFPELRFLNRHHMVPPVIFAAVLLALGGVHALVWGFAVSTVVLWHGTFTINSLSHVFGRRPFKTKDDSRNNFSLAMITMGEGWHNNHHYYPGAMSQGLYWWQIDTAAYVIRGLEKVGVVWDVHRAPERVFKVGRGKQRANDELAVEAPEPSIG